MEKTTKSDRYALLATTALTVHLLAPGAVSAQTVSPNTLPTGGQVVGGAASIDQAGAAMTVTQSTQRTAINWQTFDIGKDASVTFRQPNAQAQVLNRVIGGVPSSIEGSLLANGQVLIQNANGVLFGKGSTINVGSLLATTKNVDVTQFMAGGPLSLTATGTDAGVINEGTIEAQGYVTFVGDRVRNSGAISTPGGQVVLAAGDTATVALTNGQGVSVALTGASAHALAQNDGTIQAGADGSVLITARGANTVLDTVINMSGVVRAGTVVADAALTGDVAVTGKIDASNTDPGGRGGTVVLSGDRVGLFGEASVNVTGYAGGGTAIIGGDKLNMVPGTGAAALIPEVAFANYVQVEPDVTIDAGSAHGDGGFVETSGRALSVSGNVSAAAPGGRAGEWLIDPTNVSIQNGGPNSNFTGGNLNGSGPFVASNATAVVDSATISNALNSGLNVTITTVGSNGTGAGNIIQSLGANIITGNTASLTLEATGNISLNGNITTTGSGKLDVNLTAGCTTDNGSVATGFGTTISLGGGNLMARGHTNSSIAVDMRSVLNVGSGNWTIEGTATSSVGVIMSGSFMSGVTVADGGSLTVTGTSVTGVGLDVLCIGVDGNYTLSAGNVTFSGASITGRGLAGLEQVNVTVNNNANLTLFSQGRSTYNDYLNSASPDENALDLGGIDVSGNARLTITGNSVTGNAAGVGIGSYALQNSYDPNYDMAGIKVADSANVTITGSSTEGGGGVVIVGPITTSGGVLNITGITVGSGNDRAGVALFDNAVWNFDFISELVPLANGRTLNVSGGDVTITGTAASSAPGVDIGLGANLAVTGGNVTIISNTSDGPVGLSLTNGVSISVSGEGTTLTIAGSSSGFDGQGVQLDLSATNVTDNGTLNVIGKVQWEGELEIINDAHGVNITGADFSLDSGRVTLDGTVVSTVAQNIDGAGVYVLDTNLSVGGTGVLTIIGNAENYVTGAVALGNVNVTSNGTLNVTANVSGDAPGVELDGSKSLSVAGNGTVTISGNSALQDGVKMNLANVSFTGGTLSVIGRSNDPNANAGLNLSGMTDPFTVSIGNVTFNGTSVAGQGLTGLSSAIVVNDTGNLTIIGNSGGDNVGVTLGAVTVSGGQLTVNGTASGGQGVTIWDGDVTTIGPGIVTVYGTSIDNYGVDVGAGVTVTALDGGSVNISGDSTDWGGVNLHRNIRVMADNGSLNITGNSPSGNAVYLNDNAAVSATNDGTLNITGTATGVVGRSGNGVSFSLASAEATNGGSVCITGTSGSNDAGVYFFADAMVNVDNGTVSFDGTSNRGAGVDGRSDTFTVGGGGKATIKGASNTGDGVSMSGSTATITQGTMDVIGTAAGNGVGVNLSSSLGTLTLSSGNVTFNGTSFNGAGVSGLAQDLTVNGTGNLTIIGNSNGASHGVDLRGSINVSGNGKLNVNGTSNTSTGVQVSGLMTANSTGNLTLEGVSLSGAGTGLDLSNSIFDVSENAMLFANGTSDTGAGVAFTNLAATVSAAGLMSVRGNTTGTSTGGRGLQPAGTVDLTVTGGSLDLHGESDAGSGIISSANITATVSGGTLNMTGTGARNGVSAPFGRVIDVDVSGHGNFSLTGEGSYGIYAVDYLNLGVSEDGALTITGIGGADGGLKAWNLGVSVSDRGALDVTGNSTGSSYGLDLGSTVGPVTVEVSGGTLSVTGTAIGSGVGVSLSNASSSYVVNGGEALIHGQSSTGVAVQVFDGLNLTVNGTGVLTLLGNTNGPSAGVSVDVGEGAINVSQTGELTVDGTSRTGDGVRMNIAAVNVSGGALTVTGRDTNGSAYGVNLSGATGDYAQNAGNVTIEGHSNTGVGIGGMSGNLTVTDTGFLALIASSGGANPGLNLTGNANAASGGKLNISGVSQNNIGVVVGGLISTTGAGSRTEITGLSNSAADGVAILGGGAANSSAGGFVNITGHSNGGIGVNIAAGANVASVGAGAVYPAIDTRTNIAGTTTSVDGIGVYAGGIAYFFNGGWVSITSYVNIPEPPAPAFAPLLALAASFAAPPPGETAEPPNPSGGSDSNGGGNAGGSGNIPPPAANETGSTGQGASGIGTGDAVTDGPSGSRYSGAGTEGDDGDVGDDTGANPPDTGGNNNLPPNGSASPGNGVGADHGKGVKAGAVGKPDTVNAPGLLKAR